MDIVVKPETRQLFFPAKTRGNAQVNTNQQA